MSGFGWLMLWLTIQLPLAMLVGRILRGLRR
jgi:hypothetical protein